MDGVTIQAKVNYGLGKAASIIGLPFDQYRVTDAAATTPLQSGNRIGSVNAQMTVVSTSGAFQKAPGEDQTLWDALVDGSKVIPGDLLVNATAGTFFIGSMMPLLPTRAVRCTNLVTIHRPRIITGQVGNVGYSGVSPSTDPGDMGEDIIAADVPCALITDGYGRASTGGLLPADAPGPTKWIIWLPPFISQGMVKDRDTLIDEAGIRYQVAAATFGAFHYLLEAIRLEA